jgi:hypothetical protein
MRRRNRFLALMPVLALLGATGPSCMVPQQLFGARYSDCCRQMGNQCGSKEMPSPQSCCKSSIPDSQPYFRNAAHSLVSPGIATAIAPVAIEPVFSLTGSRVFLRESNVPPTSPPPSNSILRI